MRVRAPDRSLPRRPVTAERPDRKHAVRWETAGVRRTPGGCSSEWGKEGAFDSGNDGVTFFKRFDFCSSRPAAISSTCRRRRSLPTIPPRVTTMGGSKPQRRTRPNVLITGTPGTGKSSLAERLAGACSLFQYDVSKVAKAENLCESYDESMDTHVIEEDKVLDHMEERLGTNEGGVVVDYHSCDLFPERWFDLVVVLTCDNSVLYDRLQSRGYSEKKIRENVECEIFQTVLEEARESYHENITRVCPSNDIEEMEMNEKDIVQWIGKWAE